MNMYNGKAGSKPSSKIENQTINIDTPEKKQKWAEPFQIEKRLERFYFHLNGYKFRRILTHNHIWNIFSAKFVILSFEWMCSG